MTTLLNRICNDLRQGNRSVRELVGRIGAAESAVRRHIRTLHSINALHVARYQPGANGQQEAVYGWGEGDDAALPEARARRLFADVATLPKPVALGVWGCVW